MAYTDAGTEIRRLFIDSGPKWRISGRNSLWTYEVPGTSLACKKGTEFCVDHVIVAHGWSPINSSNRNLRVRIRIAVGSPVQSSDFLVQLDEGSPTFSSLASELSTKLSALHASSFTVTWNSSTFQFRVQQSGTQAYGFRILSDEELQTMPFNGAPVSNPTSANRILGILSATASSVGSDSDGFTNPADYGTAILLRVHSLRLVCQRLGGATLSERGSQGTIAKVALSEGFGELEVQRENGSLEGLWLPVEGTVKRLLFEVQDEYGNELVLPESCPISFTIAFRKPEED